ncbi:hypothetical protein ABBQ32_002200 [Trebouxia sp. C0010 RCD-2024]
MTPASSDASPAADLPASSESSHGQHAPLAPADRKSSPQASQSSPGKPPAAAPLLEGSKPSADRAVATADKQPSGASSAAAAAPSVAAGADRPHRHLEASQGGVSASAGQNSNDNPPAAAPGAQASESAGLETHSKVPVKPSAEEASATDGKSATSRAAAKEQQVGPSDAEAEAASEGPKQGQVKPSVKATVAASEPPAATAVAAKQSTGDLSSATNGTQAVSNPSQAAEQSTSRSADSKPSTADRLDVASSAGASSSAEASTSPGGKGSQRDVSRPSRQGASAPERKSHEQELISQTHELSAAADVGHAVADDAKERKSHQQKAISQSPQLNAAADEDYAGDAKKSQPYAGAVDGTAEEHSVPSARGAAPSKESPKEAESGSREADGDKRDSSTAELPAQERPDPVGEALKRGLPATTASSSTQQSNRQAAPLTEPQEKPSDSSSVTISAQSASAQHVSGARGITGLHLPCHKYTCPVHLCCNKCASLLQQVCMFELPLCTKHAFNENTARTAELNRSRAASSGANPCGKRKVNDERRAVQCASCTTLSRQIFIKSIYYLCIVVVSLGMVMTILSQYIELMKA